MKSAIEFHDENLRTIAAHDDSGIGTVLSSLLINYIIKDREWVRDTINDCPKKFRDNTKLIRVETVQLRPSDSFFKEEFVPALNDVTCAEMVDILSPIARQYHYKIETAPDILWDGTDMWFQPNESDSFERRTIYLIPKLGLKYKIKKLLGKQHES